MMKAKYIYTLLSLFLIIYACKKDAVVETSGYPFVTLSEVKDITTEGSTFTANILYLGNQEILDYGFVWSESNTNPTINHIIKSMGNKPSLGEFNYKAVSDLQKDRTFKVRAYVKTDKFIVYSNIQSFFSEGCLPPVITEIYPDSLSSGSILTIVGKNFSSKKNNNKVYFGTVLGTVFKSDFDTIWVQCPHTSQTLSVNIKVDVATQKSESQEKFTLVYPWKQLQNFPGDARTNSSYFTVGEKGYVCLGMTDYNRFSSRILWEYDTTTKNWNGKKMFPGANRLKSIGFSIFNKGYIGLGKSIDGNTVFRDLYEYDPVSDSWSKKADFPGKFGYYKPENFVIDQKLYIYTGIYSNELWMYDPVKDVWELMPKLNMIDNKHILGSFTIDGKGYLFEFSTMNFTTLWEFDPIQNVLVEFSKIPIPSNSWNYGDCFVFNNYAYEPIRDGKIIQYDIRNNNSYIIVAPTSKFQSNFIFPFQDKVIINNAENNMIHEFCPK